jgi:hypothetical protein
MRTSRFADTTNDISFRTMTTASVSKISLIGPSLGVIGVVESAVYAYRVFTAHIFSNTEVILLWTALALLVIAFITLPLIRRQIHEVRVARHAEGQRVLEALERNMQRLSTNWVSKDDDPRILDKMKAATPAPTPQGSNVESIAKAIKIVYPVYGVALLFVIAQLAL